MLVHALEFHLILKELDEIPTREPTREPTSELAKEPTIHEKSKLKLQQEFMNEIIANEKNINDEICWEYFKFFESIFFLAKDLIRATQSKNEQLVNNIIDGLIDLRNTINRKEIPQNENPNKLVGIVQKVLNFHGQQKK